MPKISHPVPSKHLSLRISRFFKHGVFQFNQFSNYPKKVLSRNATIDERAKEAVNKPRDFMDEDDVEMVRR